MATSEARLAHVSARNPIHRVHPEVHASLCAAQANILGHAFPSARDLMDAAIDDTKIRVRAPVAMGDQPADALADRPFPDLTGLCESTLRDQGVSGERVLTLHAHNLAQRIQMVRAFENPDSVLRMVRDKVVAVVNEFPADIGDIEVGRNPGDVLDPFILSATQALLYSGSFDAAIGATVAHKALMMIEGLLGHLHEDILGEFRGNVRAPEPRGFNQELLDPHTNPFPGADIVQPPGSAGEPVGFHQVKSKTGSAKGGDGKRLGEQLRQLHQYYGGDTYYDALIGNTLRGHRSMNGVLKASPTTVVLVGAAAFQGLTRSKVGPQLLMRVYQNAFAEAARSTGYSVQKMSRRIIAAFKERAESGNEDYLDTLIHSSIEGPVEDQDSRHFQPRRASKS